jgi:RecA-family ATPase
MTAVLVAMPPTLTPDGALIRQHLGLIAADEQEGLVEIAWTDPDAEARLRHACLFSLDKLDEAAAFAADLNREAGVNIYAGAALRREDADRHRRAKATDVLGTRVLWFDADHDAEAAATASIQCGASPTVLVTTGTIPNMRMHGYWRLPELLADQAVMSAQLRAIAARLGTDPAVTDAPRVLRLAGGVSWPRKPGRVPELVGYRATPDAACTTRLESLAAIFPPNLRPERISTGGMVADVIVMPDLIADLRDALTRLDPNDYHDWIHAGHALKTLPNDVGRALWEEWSERSEAYFPDQAEEKWQSFKPDHTGPGAIFKVAQERGWINPRSNAARANVAPQQARPPVALVRASDLLMTAPTPRRWLVPHLIPAGQVTELRGDGGAGKSTLALQLCVSAVAGALWLGMMIEHGGPAIYLASEDDADELHRRLTAIMAKAGVEPTALADFHVWPLATEDPALAALSMNRIGPTPLWAELVAHVESIRPALVVLDSRADVFAGEEINRQQVRWFVGRLRELAVRTGVAVVVLAHPSQSGKAEGTGNSGSTHWGNAVRSALYLSIVKGHDGRADTGKRLLAVVKSNYGPGGLSLPLGWSEGTFVDERGGGGVMSPDEECAKVDRLFLSLLAKCEAQGRIVSDRNGPNYAPAAFAKMTGGAGVTSAGFKAAMERLFGENRVHVVYTGRPSNGRWKLERVSAAVDFAIPQADAA